MIVIKRMAVLLALIAIAASSVGYTHEANASSQESKPATQPRLVVFEGFLRNG